MVATNIDAKTVALDIVYTAVINIYAKIVVLDIASMVVQKNNA
jgi:hypothetical protein